MGRFPGAGRGLDTDVAGIPVHIEPGFVLIAACYGWLVALSGIDPAVESPFSVRILTMTGTFVVMAVVSVLVHELGHAAAFRRVGVDCRIVLHQCGGLTVPTLPVSGRRERIAVLLAGPMATIVLIGLPALWALRAWGSAPPGWEVLLSILVWLNLYFALYNLLPVLGSDGGQILQELLIAVVGDRRGRIAAQVASAVAAFAVAWFLFVVVGGFVVGVIFLVASLVNGVQSIRGIELAAAFPAAELLDEAHRALLEGAVDDAEAKAVEALRRGVPGALEVRGAEVLAWVALSRGDVGGARRVASAAPSTPPMSPHLRCALGVEPPERWFEATFDALRTPTVPHPPAVHVAALEAAGLLAPLGRAIAQLGGSEGSFVSLRLLEMLYRAGRYEDAARFGADLMARDPSPGLVAHNVACCFARLGDADRALDWLEEAYLRQGWRSVQLLDTDDDLEPLRGVPRFEALRAEVVGTPSRRDPSTT